MAAFHILLNEGNLLMDRQTWFTIAVFVGAGKGDYGSEWAVAKEGNMSRQAAEGLLNQFAMQYRSRLFRGKMLGKLVREAGRVA